jgi:methionine-R-sulfoxide reductase
MGLSLFLEKALFFCSMLKWEQVLKLAKTGVSKPDKKIIKTEAEWRQILDPEVFRITRNKGTEYAFSSSLCSLFEPGRYACACCSSLLFDANEKFESGTGWPSFTQPISENAVAYHSDHSFGMIRVETVCNTCDAHLGHVFPDGPEPSGLRYCINALALQKV